MEDTEGLHEIAHPIGSAKADIIFLHGIGGSAFATWRYSDTHKPDHFFWPQELGIDLPDCGIWTVGYPAGFTFLGSPGMSMEKRAGNLAQKLANASLGQRPIVFVTHSMGGLVVKALLVGSQVQADKDRKSIANAVRGIVFCATPHRGSDLANAATKLGVFFGGAQDHLKEMEAGNEPLDILHDQFVEWQRSRAVAVCSYAENIGLFRQRLLLRQVPIGKVVPRESANPNIAGHTVRDVDEDHFSIVKPMSRNSDVYGGVLRFILDCLEKPLKEASNRSTQSQLGSKTAYVDVRASLASLTPTQKELVRAVAKYREGVHVSDLAEALGISRGEAVYRVRELVQQGLLETKQLTDLAVYLSSEMRVIWAEARTLFEVRLQS